MYILRNCRGCILLKYIYVLKDIDKSVKSFSNITLAIEDSQ